MRSQRLFLLALFSSLVLISLYSLGAKRLLAAPDSHLRSMPVQANIKANQTQGVELAGQLSGAMLAVALQGQYAYVGTGPRLAIVDISNQSLPVLVGQTAVLPNVVRHVIVAGNMAYVATGESGLHLVNIANPTAPVEVGSIDTPGFAQDIALSNQYAYVADFARGLRIINIATPANPTEVGYFDTGFYASGVVIKGQRAYVTGGDGLRIINVSNPAAPRQIGFYQSLENGYGRLTVANPYAYVATSGGIEIIDISTPTTPTLVGGFYLEAGALDIAVAGQVAYVAEARSYDWDTSQYTGGLRLLNITQPATPTVISFYNVTYGANRVRIVGNVAFTIINSSSLHLVNIKQPQNPSRVGLYGPTWSIGDIAVSGRYAYALADYGALHIIDVANPNTPTELGAIETVPTARTLAVAGNYVYVVSTCPLDDIECGFLYIINITRPNAPTVASIYRTDANAYGVAVSGQYVYIAGSFGVEIVSVADPAKPRRVRGLSIEANDIAVVGPYAYVVGGSGFLRIFEVSKPAEPVQLGRYRVDGWPFKLAVANNYAYVATYPINEPGALYILNVANPANPTQIGSSDFNIDDLTVQGHYAYIATGTTWPGGPGADGLQILNVANPAAPLSAAFFATPGDALGVAVAGDYVYLADGEGGLMTLRFAVPAEPPVERATYLPLIVK